MIIDVTYGGNYPWSVIIHSTRQSGAYNHFRPFLYVIADRRKQSLVEEIVERQCKLLLRAYVEKLSRGKRRDLAETISSMLDEYPKIVEEPFTALVYDRARMRYVASKQHAVLRVETLIPNIVRTLGDHLRNTYDIPCSAFNIAYPCRFVMSNIWACPLGIVPIYYGLDTDIQKKLSKLRYLVYDIEVLERPMRGIRYLISYYVTDPVSCEDYNELLNNIQVIECRGEECRDEVMKIFKEARLLVGFNNFGYDDPKLLELKLIDEHVLKSRARIDLSVFIRNNASALGIGTASQSLAMIAFALRKELNIPYESVMMKLSSARMLKSLDTAVKYNINDVAITTRLSKPMLQIIFAVAGLVQISPSAYAHRLKSGQVAEYAFVKYLENVGQVIEAREFTNTGVIGEERLVGSKVFTFKDVEAWVRAYGEELEKIRQMIDNGADIKIVIRHLWTIADRVLKRLKREEHRGSKSYGEELINRTFRGRIVWVDVNMMYPTEIVVEGIDPCAYVRGVAEDAVFDPYRLLSPYHTFTAQLREARGWAKKMAKKYKEAGDSDKASSFDLLQKSLKPIINAIYGAMTKRSGPSHGAHLQVGLKIFQNTRRKLITLLLYAYLRGWRPIYGDTDSLFVDVGNTTPEEAYNELNKVAELLGYDLSLEGVMDFMYVRAKKNYMTGKLGEKCVIKGQMISKLKHLFSPIVIARIVEALERGNLEELYSKIDQIDDPYLLVPSLGRKVTDMFLLDVEALKRRIQDTRTRIRVKLSNVIGYLKELRPDLPTRARLTALGLMYGAKTSNGTIYVDVSRMSPSDILDMRCLAITRLEQDNTNRRYKLTADWFIALVGDDLVLARVDMRSVRFVLYDYKQRKIIKIPGTYVNIVKSLGLRPGLELYELRGIEMSITVQRRNVPISEVKQIVKNNVRNWLRWAGLDTVFKILSPLVNQGQQS